MQVQGIDNISRPLPSIPLFLDTIQRGKCPETFTDDFATDEKQNQEWQDEADLR